MKISLSLSRKMNFEGRSEILLSALNRVGSKVYRMRAKSEVFISPAFFSEDKGVDFARKKVIAPDVRAWHNKAKAKLDGILSAIARAEEVTPKADITGDWLKQTVDAHLHPEKYMTIEQKGKDRTFYELVEEYLSKKQFSHDHINGFRVLVRAVARYEGFIRATEKNSKDFSFDVYTIDRDTLEDFMDYLRNEKGLSEEYSELFSKLLRNYPAEVKAGRNLIECKGENTILKMMKKLKTFFNWLIETGRTTNRPFEGIKLGCEKYGTPYYITIEERNTIAETPMPTKYLETQRDIFVFHCFVGCRVGDLMKMTASNIREGILTYAPHKTKDDGEQSRQARIPLSATALKLIAKYEGRDSNGRLFPFVSSQKYNVAIKEIFSIAGITRNVIVRNSLTGENETRAINEIASSHLARRTFIANLYNKVADPNIIGKMSGHVEGSKAFARYRNIEDDTLRSVIDLLG